MSTLTTSGCFNFLVVKASSKPFFISEIAHFFVVNSLKSPWFPLVSGAVPVRAPKKTWRKPSEIPQLLCHVTGFDPELGAQGLHRLEPSKLVQDFLRSGFRYDVYIGFLDVSRVYILSMMFILGF
jgi:hypothetical protein